MILPFYSYHDFIIVLIVGLLLDLILGDPQWLPHPIKLFGQIISFLEKSLNCSKNRKAKGVFIALLLFISVVVVFFLIEISIKDHRIIKISFQSLCFFFAIANRSLIDEALSVERYVQKGDLPNARKQLSRIVGRETSNLSFNKIRSATLETLSENLSDGVIAPLFFYLIGGIPLMMGYKMINTMDSMIGYKNERYKDFGWFAARILDDTANYIPARITAFMMVIFPFSTRGVRFILKYARQHSSPNSGYPEAALAGILDCRFGGASTYHGTVVEKPYIGNNNRDLTHNDIKKAIATNIKTLLMFVVILGLAYLISLLI